jgi:2-haloacid dehalogenase
VADTQPEADAPKDTRNPVRPELILFDVNETLSDMSPLAGRFEEVGLPAHLARTWFAGLLVDGFALTITGTKPSFREIGAEHLRVLAHELELDRDLEDAVEHVMDGFMSLEVHPDVPDGIRCLHALGIRLVTLSNGSPVVAERLLAGAGVRDLVEAVMSVDEGSAWKPAAAAYREALDRCDVAPGRAMLVAIHPWDVHGARAAGLLGGWVNRGGGRYPAHLTPPSLTAGSLTRLADLLR